MKPFAFFSPAPLGAALLVFSSAVFPAAVQAGESKVDSILELYLNFVGGTDAVSSIESRLIEGVSEMPAMNLTLPMRMTQAAPNKIHVRQEIPGMGEAIQAFDGVSGWSQDPITGFRLMSAGELASFQRMSRLDRDLDLKSIYSEITFVEETTLGDDQPVAVLKFVPEVGEPEEWYIHSETGELLQVNAVIDLGPQGRIPAQTRFSDYRDVDGLQIAFRMDVTNPAFSLTTRILSVKHNVEIDADLFSPPTTNP
jgi:hypothetical protein